MRLLFVITLVAVLIFSCAAQETSIRISTAQGKVFSIIVPTDIQEFVIAPFQIDVVKIEGLENLPNLKKLTLEVLYTLEDFSFLESLVTLEVLVLESCNIKNTDFLKSLTNLKILYLNGVGFHSNKLSLSQDMNLEVLYVRAIHSWPPNRYFVLPIEDLPSSMEYLVLDLNIFLRMTDEFLDSISHVPTIIMGKDDYKQNPEYFRKHKNFIFKPSREVLPHKFRVNTIRARTAKYGFYGG
jgi:Leucine-rich repeat (LRR) protein